MKRRFILASASPRRHDLLCSVGLEHEILVTDADETPRTPCPDGEMYAQWFARSVAEIKAVAAVDAVKDTCADDEVFVISGDTVVTPDGREIFGKPTDEADAVRMLSALSGKEHFVIGGITVARIFRGEVKYASRFVKTAVVFKDLTKREIDEYIASGEVWGKAGAYAIQGLGGVFVSSVCGDYPNVVGISTSVLFDILKEEFSLKLTEEARSQQ
ncbi:MAG: septum formation protein Maf [Clostridia bacterium]|nr:septum formation protein Maf [Clostridia bacterium]